MVINLSPAGNRIDQLRNEVVSILKHGKVLEDIGNSITVGYARCLRRCSSQVCGYEVPPGTRVIREMLGVWGRVYSRFKRERKEGCGLDV